MSRLDLLDELQSLARLILPDVLALSPDEPLKVWFEIQLHDLAAVPENEQLSLADANERLHALKHLQYLVQRRGTSDGSSFGESDRSDNSDAQNSVMPQYTATPFQVQQRTRQLHFTIEPSLRYDPPAEMRRFDPVSPTAKIVGYLRGLDQTLNLDHATTFRHEGKQLLDDLQIQNPRTHSSLAVLFQSRYHAINAMLARNQPPQIIEFAAGISPRGLQWAGSSRGTIFVESDLPQLMSHKSRLIHNSLLIQKRQLQGFLHCCGADVLDSNSIQNCISVIDDESSFALVTEGLLLYFTAAEMHQLFQNFSEVLHRYPDAIWITDLVTRQHLHELATSDEDVSNAVRKIFSLTGRSVQPQNPFADPAEFATWLAEFDLHLEQTLPLQKTTGRLQFDQPIPQSQRDRIVGSRQILGIRSRGQVQEQLRLQPSPTAAR